MRVSHLAIDGSIVTIEADADLETSATATGWAIVPSLMRTYPFTVSPAGHSEIVEENVRATVPAVEISEIETFELKGGELRVAEVEIPTATGGQRPLTVGAWEGRRGCLSTSLVGRRQEELIAMFDTLQFSERPEGLAIDSPVTMQPRTPQVIKEIPGVAVLDIRPATAIELERIPRTRGLATEHGELFRVSETSIALLFVNDTVVTRVNPLEHAENEQVMAIVGDLSISWIPRER
jgi:hypothetical protein